MYSLLSSFQRPPAAPANPRNQPRRSHLARWAIPSLALLNLLCVGTAAAAVAQLGVWGGNTTGALGNGSLTSSSVPISQAIVPPALYGKTVAQVATGRNHTCAPTTEGAVYCWGSNKFGQLGNGGTTDSRLPAAVRMDGALSGKQVAQVSTSSNPLDMNYSCAVTTDGAAYCWGSGANGQLGNGTTNDALVPVAVKTDGALSGKQLAQVSAGNGFTCAVTTDGAVYCWGGNGKGQLGDGTNSGSLVPVAVRTDGALSGKQVTQVSVGSDSTCALTTDGAAYCWGGNWKGQLGDGTNSESWVPVAVKTDGALSGKQLKQVAVGESFGCAVTTDGAAYCWGENSYGSLGNGTYGNSNQPVAVKMDQALSGQAVAGVAAGNKHTCVQTTAGAAYCWGTNGAGQLGDGAYGDSNQPVAVKADGALSGQTIAQVAVGNGYSCALTSTGAPYCWGGNGGLDGSNEPVAVLKDLPVNPLSGKTVIQAVGGGWHSCALTDDGGLYCWGNNHFGELGDGTNRTSLVPMAVKTDGALSGKQVTAVTIGADGSHTCALTADGAAYCWGNNGTGQLGNGTFNDANQPVAVKMDAALSGQTIAQLVAGWAHTCARTNAGIAYCWGYNESGQLGDGTTDKAGEPVAVKTDGALNGKLVTQLGVGDSHSCALTADAGLYCWGYNDDGELGNGSTDGSSEPVAVLTTGVLNRKTASQLAVGDYHSCVLASDGAPYCWGYNASGQLGDGTATSAIEPVAVLTTGALSGRTVTRLGLGDGHSCAVTDLDTLYCWGANGGGQVGDGTTDDVDEPVAVLTTGFLSGKQVTAVSAGYGHTLALVAATADATVSVGTSPFGLAFSVDGVAYSSTQTFSWEPGSSHTLATTSPQAGGAGIRHVFGSWSDAGAIGHTITVPASDTNYTAGFTTEYRLTTAVTPATVGYVLPLTGNWYAAGSTVNVSVTPNTGYQLGSWSGPVANANNATTTVTLSGPRSVTANLIGVPAVTAKVTGKSGTIDTRLWTLTFSNTGTGTATAVSLTGLTITKGAGVTCTPVVKTGYPVAVADVASGAPQSAAVTIDFTGCAATNKFSVQFAYTYGDASGGTYTGGDSFYNAMR